MKRAIRVPFWQIVVLIASLLIAPMWAMKAARAAGADPTSPRTATALPPTAEVVPLPHATVVPSLVTAAAATALDASTWSDVPLGGLNPNVLRLALGAATCAVKTGAVDAPSTLTVIDYSKPSTEERLWVFDVTARKLLYHELVAHGRGSGDNFATQFSNTADTHSTSIGLFVTEDTYVGRNGYSLRLNGLDNGFNDRARERAIVMHGAPYVSTHFAKSVGRLGRSWGCPALREAIARQVIDRVKGGGLVFSYYPDDGWLKSSKYLGACDESAAN